MITRAGGLRVALVAALIPLPAIAQDSMASAATINVAAGDAASLRAAVTSATDGDIVAIPVGTYALACPGPEDQTNTSGDLDIVNKSITLRGPASGTATIRPAAGCQERVIDIVDTGNPNAVTIERLTITGGRPPGSGGGINAPFTTATSLTIIDSIITDNRAGNAGANDAPSGGGVFQHSLGTLDIDGSTISNNRVGVGGGFGGADPTRGYRAAGGGVAFKAINNPTPGSVTITSSSISGNTGGIGSFGGGGGLWLDSTDVTLTNVMVTGNVLPSDPTGRSAGDGAGVAINPQVVNVNFVPMVMSVSITGGSISNNSIGSPAGGGGTANVSGGRGGGLYVNAAGGSLTVNGAVLSGNAAGAAKGAFGGGHGGNIYASATSTEMVDPLAITIDGSTISNGSAGAGDSGGSGGAGGGAFLATSTFGLGGTITIVDTTFSSNTAGGGGSGGTGGFGGGLAAESRTMNTAGSISLAGSSFVNNQAGHGGDGSTGREGGQAGGAFVWVTGESGSSNTVSVTSSTFSGNEAGSGGIGSSSSGGIGGNAGGLSVNAIASHIDSSSFDNNLAGAGGTGQNGAAGGRGGGVWIDASDVDISNNTFGGNRSGHGGDGTTAGGGAAGGGGGLMLDIDGSANVSATTFDGNRTGDGGDGGSNSTSGSGGAGGFGAGISVDNDAVGAVSLTNVTMTGNEAGTGGDAVGNRAGSGGFGGGVSIRSQEQQDIDIVSSTLDGNTAGDAGTGPTATSAFGGWGGAIYVSASHAASSLVVLDTVIANNSSGNGSSATGNGNSAWPAGSGGGVHAAVGDSSAAAGDNGTISIASSSVTGNLTGSGGTGGPNGGSGSRGGAGGGLWLSGGEGNGGLISIANSTIADNVTGAGGGSANFGDGGGLFLDSTTDAEVLFSTITGNTGLNGDNLFTTADTTTFRATVLGEPGSGNNGDNCRVVPPAAVASLGYNVETQLDTCELTDPTDLVDLDAIVLGPLQDNGGVGLSRLPLILGGAPLPVLDRVPNPCGNSIDQLGTTRPKGAGCDVGAVEAELAPITAVDDVIRVDGGTTTLDFVDNDDLQGFTPADTTVTVTKHDSADQVELINGVWTFRARSRTGAYTTFTYEVCLGASGQLCDTATVALVPDALSRFVSLSPGRLFDTRETEPGNGPKGFVEGESSIDVQITGVAGVPASGVSAVAMNITATQVEGPGFVTAFPTGQSRPLASNLNFASPGDTIPNFVIVPVGAGGNVTLYSKSGTHLLADVAGYFTEGGISQNAANAGSSPGRLIPLNPSRVFDTREDQPAPGPKGFVRAGATIDVQIAGRAGVPTSGVSAVVVNLTATASDGPGFVTAFPAGSTRPKASNLNLTGPGQTTPNLVIVPLGDSGKISIYTKSGVHLLGDVTGYFTDSTAPRSLSGLFAPASPGRAFDTREGEAPPGSKGFLTDGQTIAVRFTANSGTPASGAGAVIMNATATGAAAPGFVTVWSDGQTRPKASTLNLTFAGQTRPNAAIIPIGSGGRISFYTLHGVDLLADVFGWFLE